jgi:Mn-dependent DtxR family transcriptional regulator
VIAVDTLHIGNRAVDRLDVLEPASFSRHIVTAVLVPPRPAQPQPTAADIQMTTYRSPTDPQAFGDWRKASQRHWKRRSGRGKPVGRGLPGATSNPAGRAHFGAGAGCARLGGAPHDPNNRHQLIRQEMPGDHQLGYWRRVVRLAALCHDIGHLPFSHAAEHDLLPPGWNHERLTFDLINSKGYARVVDIATSLKISQASVTNMVQRLDADGLLKYEKYRGLALTTAGETLARNITRRHQLLTDFFKLLGLDDKVIYHDVEGMEHHISAPTLRAIELLTRRLRRRPALLARLAE